MPRFANLLPSLLVVAWATVGANPVAAAETIDRPGDFLKLDAANDWPWWRGPRRDGHAHASAKPPTVFSDTQNVVWKVPVPGRGHASPVVVGSQVFLATADDATQTQSVLAFDRATGKPLWQTELSRGGFPKIHRNNTHASPTCACDGELVFVTFHHHDQLQAAALSRDGKIVWNRSLGEFHPRRYEYGYGPSPVLYRNTVIVAAEFDGPSFLVALDRRIGNDVWKTPRPTNMSYSSPSILPIGGRDVLSISGADQVAAYDPATGAPLWSVPGTSAATCGTTVADGGILFASGGYPKAETIAVRATGGADGKSGEVLWKNAHKCYEQSMLAVDGYLYALTDNGGLFCFRGSDGKEMWRERLKGPVSSSPILAGGHIYWANERGTHYVFKPNPQRCEMVAENVLGDESFASPAAIGLHLFVRAANTVDDKRQEFLYCFGSQP